MRILVLYHSMNGHTLNAANAAAEGIRRANSVADVVSVADFKTDIITEYDGVIFGGPCWEGCVTRSGSASALSQTMEALPADCLGKKRCGDISICYQTEGTGPVNVMQNLVSLKGCKDYRPGPVVKVGKPFAKWQGPSVGPQDKERFKDYGTLFVA